MQAGPVSHFSESPSFFGGRYLALVTPPLQAQIKGGMGGHSKSCVICPQPPLFCEQRGKREGGWTSPGRRRRSTFRVALIRPWVAPPLHPQYKGEVPSFSFLSCADRKKTSFRSLLLSRDFHGQGRHRSSSCFLKNLSRSVRFHVSTRKGVGCPRQEIKCKERMLCCF